ncbi:MAG: type II secretion system F family protein [Candidatus Omnitrophica bacterium]|nr:type II secretion system F family protein [Candidatus Omnitrophota bacterium]
MAKFFYIARDKAGRKETGVIEAPNQDDVISRLHAKALIVISIFAEHEQAITAVAADAIGKKKHRWKRYRITNDDLVILCRQLATLLGAGVTILKSLDIIAQQVTSRRLYNIIKDLEKNMEAGLSFHAAVTRHPDIFSELWTNLIESGEASGSLAMVLSRLAAYLERNAAFKRKVVSALIYPVILLLAGTGALFFLTFKIIPTFAELFKGFGITLPFLTRLLIAGSNFLKSNVLIIIGLVISIFWIIRKYLKTKIGRRKFEEFAFTLPVFGDFFRALVVERFSSGMSTLIESGVPIIYSLQITEHTVANLVLSDIVRGIKEAVRDGKSLSQQLEKSDFFEPMVVQMVRIGEEIGELPDMFKRINAFYQEYVETFLTRVTSMFEPLMLLFMGVVIGIMIIGMFLPIFQIAQIGG